MKGAMVAPSEQKRKSKMTKEEIIKEYEQNGFYLISDGGNKIEFSNGDTYAKDSHTGLYRKVKTFVL